MSITDELREWINGNTIIHVTELRAIADRIDAEMVELPKDADGAPIRVGDVLTDGEYTFVVDELATFGDGSWSIRNEDGDAWKARDVTHHHKPTVEDVLREFAEKITDSQIPNVHPTYEEAIAEYAAKLRLAGDGE